MKEIDQAIREAAAGAENAAKYIAEAIEAGDKILGVRQDPPFGAVITFQEADGLTVEVNVQAVLRLADLIRREKVIA